MGRNMRGGSRAAARAGTSVGLSLFVILCGCGIEGGADEADTERAALASGGQSVPGGPATFAVVGTGPGWQRLSVSGMVQDVATNTTRTLNNDEVYVVTGTVGIAQVPLPATIRNELWSDYAASAATSSDPAPAVYFVHRKTAEQVAAGQLKAVATPGVQSYALCGNYDKTISKSVSFDKPINFSKSFGSGDFTGNLQLSGRVKGSASADVRLRVQRKLCVPYWVKLKDVRVKGSLDANARVTSSGSFSNKWSYKEQVAKFGITSFTTMIGPIPLRIGFNVPIDLGLDASAQASAQLDGTARANGAFDVVCTTSDCSGSKSFSHSFTSEREPSVGLNGRAKVKPWIQGAVRAYLYSDAIAYGQVGVRPAIEGDLWGYAGNTCGDGDEDGSNEWVSGLTFDADLRVDVTARVYVVALVDKDWSWNLGTWHVGFWDLLPGGSSAAAPMFWRHDTSGELLLPGVTPPSGVPFRGRMRPCWPYTNKVQYRIDWADGALSNFALAPASQFTRYHEYGGSLPSPITLTARYDSHGRALDRTTAASTGSSFPSRPTFPVFRMARSL